MANNYRKTTAWITCFLASVTSTSLSNADDTDIFTINPNITAQRPNILIILDNTANWNSVFTAEKAALVSTFSGLDERFNVGLELFTNANDKETTALASNAINSGGYIRAAIRQMTSGTGGTAEKYAALVNAFTSSNGSGGDGGDNAYFGLAMAEAYRYFSGTNQYAGAGYRLRDYSNNPNNTSGNTTNSEVHALTGSALSSSSDLSYESPISDACQKNFIIFISNGQSNLNENSGGTVLNLFPSGANTAQIPLTPNHFEGSYADEWARYMANNDINSSEVGDQTVVTYTLDVNPSTSGNGPDNTALLKSMASEGNGKYFATTGDTAAIVDALNDIFTEVAAVNTVFASSTLPVSVNVRGTYLNQVYMGVFRPDAHGNPRWVGNLKEYQLGINGGNVELQDKNGVAAANTSKGFISPTVTSIWTTNSTFWNESYYGEMGDGGASDAPDGDLVEKGGTAQKLRTSYATDQSSRNLYTCSTSCGAGDALADTPFITTNTELTNADFGITPPQSVTSLTRTANSSNDAIVTATVANHGYTTGTSVTIAGAGQLAYNGTYPITVVDANTFRYSITVSPSSPATGTVIATVPGATATITNISYNGTTATATAAGHTFSNGDIVSISGTAVAAFNDTFTISGVVAGSSFQFPVTQQPITPGGGGTAQVGTVTKNIETSTANPSPGITRSGNTVTVRTTANHGFGSTGSTVTVTITGATPTAYNGTWTATITGNKSFTYSISASPVSGSNTAGTFTAAKSSGVSATLTSLTRLGTTVTANTGSTNLGLSAGSQISISGANETEYVGTFTVASVDNTNTAQRKFTYTISTTPTTPATGTITSSTGGVGGDKNMIINWTRGQNVLTDDNPSGSSSDVRGYLHGDVVHSRPLVVDYNRTGTAGTDIVVFYGSNDGIFHAVKGGKLDTDGYELWGFIPTELMPTLSRLYENTPIISSLSPKPYFLDGPIGVYQKDVNNDGTIDSNDGDKVYLYLTARRGGRLIYALDVSDPANPKLLWKKTNSSPGYSELGYTWSEPKVVTIRAHANPVLIFGAGYDPTAEDADSQGVATMGRAIYVVDAFDGSIVTTLDATDNAALIYPIPSDIVPLNTDHDAGNNIDRLYVGDTGGQVWRANIDDADVSNWELHVLASVGGNRKFLFSPDVIYYPSYDAVLIGSGDREHPFETSTTNRFYMLKDNKGTSANPPDPDSGNDGIEESDLCDATNYYTDTTLNSCLANPTKYGWYFTLQTGEKVVGNATSQNQTVFFGTNTPSSVINQAGYCGSDLGEARLYAIDARNASSRLDLNGDGVINAEDAYTVYPGGGLPPSPVPIVVELENEDGETELKEVTCFGPTCIVPPGLEYNQRYRSYWYFEGDE
jgi:type IV pilus assembly protein PilY1